MSRYRGPRLRIVRRLGELPGLTSKVPKKQNPPGQHGQAQAGAKRKMSQYSVRLREKQRLRFHYGITEFQLLRYVKEARKAKGSTGELLLQLLEMRLDSVVFRLGMAPTMAAARQLVGHGHIQLNEKKVTIPSYRCLPQDKVSVVEKKNSRNLVASYLENSYEIPGHLSLQKQNFQGNITKVADRSCIGLKINELLIVEFYSRKI